MFFGKKIKMLLCVGSLWEGAVSTAGAFSLEPWHRLLIPSSAISLEDDRGIVPIRVVYSPEHEMLRTCEFFAVRVPSPDPSRQLYLTLSEVLEGAVDIRVNNTWAERYFLHPLRHLGRPGHFLLGALSCSVDPTVNATLLRSYAIHPDAATASFTDDYLYAETLREPQQREWRTEPHRFRYSALLNASVIEPFWTAYEDALTLPEALAPTPWMTGYVRGGPVLAVQPNLGEVFIRYLVCRFGPDNVLLYEMDPRMQSLIQAVLCRPKTVADHRLEDASFDALRHFYETSLITHEEVFERAAQGDAHAQFYAGVHLASATPSETMNRAALTWLHAAERQGHSEASAWLGLVYARTMTSLEQRQRAFRHLEQGARTALPWAQYQYGLYRIRHAETTKDQKVAYEMFRRAAEQGDVRSQFCLGKMLCRGLGVSPNATEGRLWVERAAQRGYAKAQHLLALMHHQGFGGPRDGDAFQAWMEAAAQNGHTESQMLIAMVDQHHGWRSATTLPLPMWIAEGEKRGDPRALYLSARRLLSSESVKVVLDHAVQKFQRAADHDLPQAQFWLGNMYLSGLGGVLNATRAFAFFEAAACLGHGPSCAMLSVLYASGLGVPQDHRQAAAWAQKTRVSSLSAPKSHDHDATLWNVTQFLRFDP